MGIVLGKNRFLNKGSEMEDVVSINLMSIARWFGGLLVVPIRAIGFTVLAMFGAWPALFYMIYVAMDS